MFDRRNFQDQLVHNSYDKSIGLNPPKRLPSNAAGGGVGGASGVPLYRRDEQEMPRGK